MRKRSTSLLHLMSALALETGLATGLVPDFFLGRQRGEPFRPSSKKVHRPGPPGTWKPHPSRGRGNQHTPPGYPPTKRRRKTARQRTHDYFSYVRERLWDIRTGPRPSHSAVYLHSKH